MEQDLASSLMSMHDCAFCQQAATKLLVVRVQEELQQEIHGADEATSFEVRAPRDGRGFSQVS